MTRMGPGDHPRRQAAATRRGNPQERLLRCLLAIAGPGARIAAASSRPWASATFQGSRHEIALRFSGKAARDRMAALAAELPEAEFAIPGHILADLSIDGRESVGDTEGLLALSALVIEDW